MHRKGAAAKTKGTLGLEPFVVTSLAVALLFFILSTAVAVYTTQLLRDSNEKVIQTHRVIVAIDLLLSDVQDAETGQRGYLLTGNERYLDPYHKSGAQLQSRISTVEQLIGENGSQQQRFSELKSYIASKFAELQETIDVFRSQGAQAALTRVNSDRGKADMDSIRSLISDIRAEETEERATRVAGMNNAYTVAFATSLMSGALGIILTLIVGTLMRRATIERRRDQWMQKAQVGLGEAVIGDQTTSEVGENILRFLADYVGAVAGAIYVEDNDRYRLSATFGVPPGATLPDNIRRDDGLFGHVAADHRPITVGEVPDGYITFGSTLGQQKPRFLTLAPAIVDGEIKAVFELGFLHPVGDQVLALLEQSSGTIATAIRSAEFRTQLQKLLYETQRQAEELQVQGEELRVSNEELEEQGRALKESQARLEQQQVELEQTNSQLEEQAQERPGKGQCLHQPEGPGAGTGEPLQVGLPRQHVARASHAAEFVADPRQAFGRQYRREPDARAGEIRPDDPVVRQ